MPAGRYQAGGWLRGMGVLLLLLLGPVLAACGGPSPTRLAITIIATPQTNTSGDHQASPIVVRLYDLAAPDHFNAASFNELFYDDSRTLGADMLARREIDIPPGKTVKLDSVAASGTSFLGVLGGFRDLEGNNWRNVVAVDPHHTNRVIITLQARSLTLSQPSSGFLGIF